MSAATKSAPEATQADPFSERFRALRKARGFSQAELAEAVDVHFTQVSRYERGGARPNAETVTRLARALDTSVDYLMNGTTDDVAADAGLERELIARLRQVQDLPREERRTVLSLLDAFIAKTRIQEMLRA